ncbi:MAG TPA: NUDIX domain-containing protein [Alphaproteobacteria bacterium]|nr:NUDIX domain-containing protein [Alphaproteobacteria bacterium]
MALVALFKNSAAPRLLYRFHLAWMKATAPITLGVRAMIINDEGEVLLVRHSYRPGWYFPGGGVKKWETMAQAAEREAREEAGVDPVRLDGPVGLYANFQDDRSDHVVLYLTREWRTVATSSAEIVETGFFPMRDLPPDTTDATRRRVEEHLGLRDRSDLW